MTTIGSKYRGKKEFLLVYCALIQAARMRKLVYYKQVWRCLDIPAAGNHYAREVGQVLGEVSEDEHEAGRPMLSAIAVNEAGFPGQGFFTLARRLGKLHEGMPENEFLEAERQLVYAEWKPFGAAD